MAVGLGFFKKESSKSIVTTRKKGTMDCNDCGLYKTCNSPRMTYSGQGKRGILIIAEAPGEEEDKKGTQLIGPAGQLLNKKLEPFGLELDRDFFKINALNCRPPKNRKPTKKEIECCKPRIYDVIREVKPRFIFLFGGAALESFLGGKYDTDKLQINNWKQHCFPDPESGAWVIPLFHPSALLQNKDDCLEASFDMDLKWAVSCLDLAPPEIIDYKKFVKPLLKAKDVINALYNIKVKKKSFVIDYETSGKKPYKPGHKIYAVGICTEREEAISFPLHYPHWSSEDLQAIEDLLCELLTDPDIKKTAHNIKFEHKWTRAILKVEPQNWYWDSMLAQHVIDSRRHVTSLKFQALARWGVYNYDAKVRPFIEKDDGNGFNSLHKCSLADILEYVGLDALFEYKLTEEQLPVFKTEDKLLEMYDLFHEGTLAFANSEDQGICANERYYEEEKKRIQDEVKTIEAELMTGLQAARFKERMGRDISLTSNKDLSTLFFDIMGIKPTKLTGIKKEPAMDEEVLNSIKLPFAINLVKKRKLEKITGTYIAQFEREIWNGKIQPFFDLNTTETGRSSSSMPNFQNIPKRDKAAKKSCRSGIIPSPGFKLMEVDYSQIEVRIMACYTHDPVLIKYIMDKSTDMHRDQSCNIFFLQPGEVTKGLRGITKGDFVFAQFYGDWYKQCAENIWEDMVGELLEDGMPIMEHLSKHGIHSYQHFENHMKGVEDGFWSMLRVSKQWRQTIVNLYKTHGYVDTFFGFRRSGYLRKNQIYNAPVQGTAFHCLLWSYCILNQLQKAEKWKSKLIGQIHDAILFDLCPEEEEYVRERARWAMCEAIKKDHPWLIVPLEIEMECSEIDGSWSTMKGDK